MLDRSCVQRGVISGCGGDGDASRRHQQCSPDIHNKRCLMKAFAVSRASNAFFSYLCHFGDGGGEAGGTVRSPNATPVYAPPTGLTVRVAGRLVKLAESSPIITPPLQISDCGVVNGAWWYSSGRRASARSCGGLNDKKKRRRQRLAFSGSFREMDIVISRPSFAAMMRCAVVVDGVGGRGRPAAKKSMTPAACGNAQHRRRGAEGDPTTANASSPYCRCSASYQRRNLRQEKRKKGHMVFFFR